MKRSKIAYIILNDTLMGERLYISRKNYTIKTKKIVLVQFKKPQVHRMSEFFNWTSTIFHLEEYNFFLHWTRAHMIIEFICYSFKVFESSNGAFKFFNNSVEHLKILNHPVEHLDIVSRAYRFQQSN